MRAARSAASAAVVLAALAGCQETETTFVGIRELAVSEGVRLEVVEWGGNGPAVVFLAGLGHTAHVFDEIAPALTDRYRVLGITRRGFGASSQPDSGYGIPALADDIRIVLDSLGIERAVLAGHSLGGDEMTWLVRHHPDRVAALVYIEAAYDRVSGRAAMADVEPPESHTPLPTADDSASADADPLSNRHAGGGRYPYRHLKLDHGKLVSDVAGTSQPKGWRMRV